MEGGITNPNYFRYSCLWHHKFLIPKLIWDCGDCSVPVMQCTSVFSKTPISRLLLQWDVLLKKDDRNLDSTEERNHPQPGQMQWTAVAIYPQRNNWWQLEFAEKNYAKVNLCPWNLLECFSLLRNRRQVAMSELNSADWKNWSDFAKCSSFFTVCQPHYLIFAEHFSNFLREIT